jgi:hypothetical protein
LLPGRGQAILLVFLYLVLGAARQTQSSRLSFFLRLSKCAPADRSRPYFPFEVQFEEPMLRSFGLSLAILVSLASAALATPTIVIGNYPLPSGSNNNVIQIFVTGGDQVQGLNFIMDINNDLPGGPTIMAVDILTGTIFAGNNTGQGGGPAPLARRSKPQPRPPLAPSRPTAC